MGGRQEASCLVTVVRTADESRAAYPGRGAVLKKDPISVAVAALVVLAVVQALLCLLARYAVLLVVVGLLVLIGRAVWIYSSRL